MHTERGTHGTDRVISYTAENGWLRKFVQNLQKNGIAVIWMVVGFFGMWASFVAREIDR